MNSASLPTKSLSLSTPALLSAIAGLILAALLLFADMNQNWIAAGITIFLTVLISVYLQIIGLQARQAARMIANGTSELALFQQLLRTEKTSRTISHHALSLQDRAIELSAIAISIYDAKRTAAPLLYVNPAFERMTGYASADLIGIKCCELHLDEQMSPSTEQLRALLETRSSGNFLLRNRRKDGSIFWSDMHFSPVADESGEITHFVATQTDVTALKTYEEKILHTTRYDALTGLANRFFLRDRFRTALVHAAAQNREVWILFLGLDRFKLVNEVAGHAAGDQVLKILADRLGGCISATDTVSRFSGDEFVILLQAPSDEKAATEAIDCIMSRVALPVCLDGNNIFVSCSVGVAVFPTDGDDVETLIQHADSAMHGAKARGPNSYHYFTPQMNERALERGRLESDLRVALDRQQLFLHYQPKVDLRSGRIVGMEALIRWQHPLRGLVAPGEFIGLAEEAGLIVPIGAWVIQTACRQMKRWQSQGFVDLRISVNLSAKQFSDEALVGSIATILRETGLHPKFLELELTESLVMTDADGGFGTLRGLKALGLSLAVDDFGTGYSSLAYLKHLPIDTLKIDQSFVNDITDDIDDAVIVTSIISLAHNLRLSVVAEGVETSEQLSFLQLNGCDEIQGYRFSHPVSAEDFTLLLEQRKSIPPYIRSPAKELIGCTNL